MIIYFQAFAKRFYIFLTIFCGSCCRFLCLICFCYRFSCRTSISAALSLRLFCSFTVLMPFYGSFCSFAYGSFALLWFFCSSMTLFVLLWFFCSSTALFVLLRFFSSFTALLPFCDSYALLQPLCSFTVFLHLYIRLSCGIALRPATCAADSLTGIPGPTARTVRYLSDSPAISPWTGWIPDRL